MKGRLKQRHISPSLMPSFPPTDLRKLEKQQNNVRLRMRHHSGSFHDGRIHKKSSRSLCNLHHQSVATYVKKLMKVG